MQLDDYKEGIKLYNSQNMSDQLVKDNFVVRKRHFDKVWKDISEAMMQHPEQHYIVQGVRGSGKTTLLNRLAIEVKEHPELQTHLIPVVMKEEEYGISNLFRFWERVAEELHESNSELFPEILEQFDELEEADPKKAVYILTSQLKKAEQKIILFIDNLVELFDHFSDFDTALLREILTTNPFVRIIGGSAISLEAFYDNGSPFYQFFKVVKLQGLNKKDTITLLKKLAQYEGEEETLTEILKNNPGKIESIRRLTGGIPRTISILFNVLMEGPKGTTFSMLEDTIDKTTPLYKHRMDDLSKQQKPIIDAIALNWDAMSAKEIKAVTRLESKTISAQLSQLEKQWLVEKVNTDGKNKLYRLKERFFNIWYLMRYGRRKDRRRVKWLTQFMEIWCSKDDLKNRSQAFVEQLNGELNHGGHPRAALWFANAMLCSEHLGVLDKYAVRECTQQYLMDAGSNNELRELFPVFDNQNANEARSSLDELLQIEKFPSLTTDEKTVLYDALKQTKYTNGLWFYYLLEKDLDSALEHSLTSGSIELEEITRVLMLTESNKLETAIDYIKNSKTLNTAKSELLQALMTFAVNFPNIVKLYELAIEKFEDTKVMPLVEFYLDKNEFDKAEVHIERAVANEEKNALYKVCIIYLVTNKFDKLLDRATQLEKDKKHVLDACILKAKALIEKQQAESAIEILITGRSQGALYLESLVGEAYSQLGRHCEAEKEFALAINSLEHFAYLSFPDVVRTYEYLGGSESLEKLIEKAYEHEIISIFELIEFHLETANKKFIPMAFKQLNHLQKVNVSSIPELSSFVRLHIWADEFETAQTLMEEHFPELMTNIDKAEQDLLNIFIFLLAKDQTNLVDRWLREYDLSERFKPLYFALMHLMKDKYPNEYLRMGEELLETVEEILERIKETAEKYK